MTTSMIANARVWNAVVFPSVMKCIPNDPSPLYCLSVRTAMSVRTASVRIFNEHTRLWFSVRAIYLSVRAIYHWLPNHPDEREEC